MAKMTNVLCAVQLHVLFKQDNWAPGGGAKQQRQGQGGELDEALEQAGSQVSFEIICNLKNH